MKEKSNNIKLGATVLIAAIALVTGLYLIGDKKNLFDKTFTLKASFYDVNGLTVGNNVTFAGIAVGTVQDITITSDTAVLVTMIVKDDVQKYILKNAVAVIGSEGMMGNKQVNINSAKERAPVVADGDVLRSINPVSMDETTRTLSATNANLKEITDNLKNMTYKLDSSALWSVLADTTTANNLKAGAQAFSENMQAAQSSFLLKGYFKKKKEEREDRKDRKKDD
jgi:phospholipid/cholesterol/gamma-HCH transport system substrate-binding protein